MFKEEINQEKKNKKSMEHPNYTKGVFKEHT
jgi:hypothetical protein